MRSLTNLGINIVNDEPIESFFDMKIEIGESLFYSWLRHIKQCQVAQANWKPSPKWNLHNQVALEHLMRSSKEFFAQKYKYDIFGNIALPQLLSQAEIDVVGLTLPSSTLEIYAVDVAYHESGLNYSDKNKEEKNKNSKKVIQKFLRTAICIWGYFNMTNGELIFASPKINNSIMTDLEPALADTNALFRDQGLNFTARIIANDDFKELVLQPVLDAGEVVSDTSELFMRAYKLLKMFDPEKRIKKATPQNLDTLNDISYGTQPERKMGEIAQTTLRDILESGIVAGEEINNLLTKEYSKRTFDLKYPLLAIERDPQRHYAKPLEINGKRYFPCNDWYENNRPYLLKWLKFKQICTDDDCQEAGNLAGEHSCVEG